MKKIFIIATIVGAVFGIISVCISSADNYFWFYKLLAYVLMFCSLRIGLLKDEDYFSPFTMFSSFPFAILLYSDYVSDLYLPLPGIKSMFYILVGGWSFFCGLFFYRLRNYKQAFVSESVIPGIENGTYDDSTGEQSGFVKYSYVNLFLLAMIPYALSILTKNPLQVLEMDSTSIAEFRSQVNLPIISSLHCCIVAALICAAQRRRVVAYVYMVFVALALSLLMMSKASVVILFMVTLYAIMRYKNLLNEFGKIKYLKTIVVVGVIVIITMFNVYKLLRSGYMSTGEYQSNYEFYYEDDRVNELPESLRVFFTPYMYMTTPLSNLAFLVETGDDPHWGRMTAWPVISTFQLKRLFDIEQHPIAIRMYPYNTHSFLGDFYADFHFWGILFLPAFLAMLVYYMYIRSLKNPDCLVSAEYFYFAYATFMLFFSNHFTSVAYPFRFLIIFEGYRFIARHFKKS